MRWLDFPAVQELVAELVEKRLAEQAEKRVAAEVEKRVAEQVRERMQQRDIVKILHALVGVVTDDIVKAMEATQDEVKLDGLLVLAARCPDVDAFRQGLQG